MSVADRACPAMRTVLDGVLWRARGGARWPAVPNWYGRWNLIWPHFRTALVHLAASRLWVRFVHTPEIVGSENWPSREVGLPFFHRNGGTSQLFPEKGTLQSRYARRINLCVFGLELSIWMPLLQTL